MATSTGWAHSDGSGGVWKLGSSSDSVGKRARSLLERLECLEFDRLAVEAVISYGHEGGRTSSVIFLAKLMGAVECWAERVGIPLAARSPAEIKAFACGRGNASKSQMMAAAKRQGADFGGRHDACDAWWLLRLEMHLARLKGMVCGGDA